MSKRFAGSQITREGLENDDGFDEDDKPFDKPKNASDSVMSARKIAIPKRKMAGGLTSHESPKLFKVNNHTNSAENGQSETVSDTNTNEKLMALNLQFKEKISDAVSADPFVDLSFIFDKYRSYYSSVKGNGKPTVNTSLPIKQELKPAPAATFTFGKQPDMQTAQNANPFAFASKQTNDVQNAKPIVTTSITKPIEQEKKPEPISVDDSDSSDENEAPKINVEGPKFVLNKQPTTSDPPFSFGDKRKDSNSESDSDGEVEIKGPQFTFSGTVSTGKFTLPNPDKAKEANDKATPSTEVKPQDKQSSTLDTNSGNKTAFSFGTSLASNKTESKLPPFGVSSDKSSDKSSFTFGVSGSTANKTDETKKIPSFTFGSTKPVETTGFSSAFGKTENASKAAETQKPMFGGFNTNNGETKPASKPSFTFGSASTSSAFTFGKQESDEKLEKKPTFTFGSTSAPSVPAFSFGSKKSEANEEQPPSSGFKFSLPFANNNDNLDKQKNTNETSGENTEEPVVDTEEPSKPLNLSNGEENENLLFSQRAKLMVYNTETKAYDSRGLGELKVLQQKDNKAKARILCRSDGMGHILLNTSVVKSFTYAPLDQNNENLVKCPVVNSEGKLDTFIIKVKQKADGRKLVQSIKDAQESM